MVPILFSAMFLMSVCSQLYMVLFCPVCSVGAGNFLYLERGAPEGPPPQLRSACWRRISAHFYFPKTFKLEIGRKIARRVSGR